MEEEKNRINRRIKGPGERGLSAREKTTPTTRKSAIALRYDVDRDKAPLIVATGRGPVADEILRIADDNKIPLSMQSDCQIGG